MNLLFIIADDHGLEQLSTYNGAGEPYYGSTGDQPAMPAVNGMATNGVYFKRFYTTPACSPTRACYHTGRYGARTGVGLPRHVMLDSEITLPRLLTLANTGHETAFIGKYHLATQEDWPFTPLRLGWDYVASVQGNLNAQANGPANPYERMYVFDYYVQGELRRNRGKYMTSLWTSLAADWIDRQTQAGREWVCFLSHNAPHDPYNRPPMNLYSTGSWGSEDEPATTGQADTRAFNRNTYKASLEALDTETARLLASIDYSTTYVCYIADNGTRNTGVGNVSIDTEDILVQETHPDNGAYPFREGKLSVYEPGIRCPMIWRGGTVAGTNRALTQVTHAVDLYATFADMLGVSDVTTYMPARGGGRVVDGVSFKDMLETTAASPEIHDFILSETFNLNAPNAGTSTGERALIGPQYKLAFTQLSATSSYEFYDLAGLNTADQFETTGSGNNAISTGTDVSSLTTAEAAARTALIEGGTALFATVDLDYAQTTG